MAPRSTFKMPSSHHPRLFSTASRIHPNLLPHMQHHHPNHQPPRRPRLTWLAPLLGLSLLAIAAHKLYFQPLQNQRTAAVEASQRQDAERRRQHEALMDEYGDRSSLEALEKAVQHYEKK